MDASVDCLGQRMFILPVTVEIKPVVLIENQRLSSPGAPTSLLDRSLFAQFLALGARSNRRWAAGVPLRRFPREANKCCRRPVAAGEQRGKFQLGSAPCNPTHQPRLSGDRLDRLVFRSHE